LELTKYMICFNDGYNIGTTMVKLVLMLMLLKLKMLLLGYANEITFGVIQSTRIAMEFHHVSYKKNLNDIR
jgi:hypothetical protein